MKALSLWQPWASLIYDGRKTIETRHWEMLYRGPLAIHATQLIDKNACTEFGYEWESLPRGAILCIVHVETCVRLPHLCARPDDYGDFTEGRFGIVMTLLEKFPAPIPAKGKQGMWNWTRP